MAQAGELKVQALVSEDLALQGVVGVGAGFTALLQATIEREAQRRADAQIQGMVVLLPAW